MIFEITEPEITAPLFAGWQETLVWSCLQGTMGKIYGDHGEKPESVMALLGDFAFFAGKPDRELAMEGPRRSGGNFLILTPREENWAELILDCHGPRVRKGVRYAIKKEPDVFDREKLQAAVDGLGEEYELRGMDEELFWRCREIPWCRDWAALYRDYAHYQDRGLGAIILKDGEPVSGASSYAGYLGGIEIEIDTRTDYRRRGLAYICGAKLILDCLERGWYPSWDAQNLWSVALAQKLGYHFDHEYIVYEWSR
ncbi:MAG: GNAT family N-acetyltransferase [Lachnospiraceae bacterium]|nr:GNAT family N-acetyltransferase [Lachnospiraceae bacterium]